MIEHLQHEGQRRGPAVLYWGCRRKADLYLHDWCVQQAAAMPNAALRAGAVASRRPEDAWDGRTGFVHQAVMADLPDLSGHQVYACGAPVMVERRSATSSRAAACRPRSSTPTPSPPRPTSTARPPDPNRPRFHPEETPTDAFNAATCSPPRCRHRRARPLLAQSAHASAWSCPTRPAARWTGIARVLAEAVKDSLGTVVVENKPGAGGNLGADQVARSAPDGTDDRDGRGGHARDQPLAVRQDALRPDPRLHADHAGGPGAQRAGDERRGRATPEDRHARRPRRLCQGQPGQAELRLGRQRQRRPPGRRDCSRPRPASSRCTSPTPAAPRRSWRCWRARSTSTSTTWPRRRATSAPASCGAGGDDRARAPPRCPTCRRWPRPGAAGLATSTSTPGSACSARPACPPSGRSALNAAFIAALASAEVKAKFAPMMAEPAPNSPAEFAAFVKAELAKYEHIVKATGARVG